MQLDSQYLHCIQKAPTQGVGRTKPHPDRFDRLVEGISRMLKQYEDHCFGNKDTQMILCIAEYKIKINYDYTYKNITNRDNKKCLKWKPSLDTVDLTTHY